MITCRVLGPVEIVVDDDAAPAELLWRKNLALLVYLARSAKRSRSRDHLIGLLWADKQESAARHSLNEAIRVLRKHVGGEEALRSEGDQVRLAEGAIDLDVDRLEAALAREDWAAAAALIAGDFMEGFSISGCSQLEDWLHAERLALRQSSVRALVARGDELLDAGEAAAAAAVAARALNLDPFSDRAVRIAMRSHAVVGDRAAALELYETFARRLEEEVGIEPGEETRALVARVRGEKTWRISREAALEGLASGSRRAPLLERDVELEGLIALWSGCRNESRTTLAVLEGDPGIGKSRLAEELAARARLDGATVATARAVPADRSDPWSGLLAVARGIPVEALGADAESQAAVEELIGVVERGEVDEDDESRSPVRTLMRAIASITSQRPVLLALDDAHWLDGDSLRAVGALLRDLERAPLFVLLATGPHAERVELDELQSRIGRDLSGASIRLEPLSVSALRQLARWMLPNYDDVELDRVARRVSTDSAGLPLLAVELLHAVAAGLDLASTGGAWPEPLRTLDQTLPGELPDTVVAAVRVSFRRLSQDAQRVVAAAAVLDERVDETTLARVTGLEPERVASALDEAEWLRWLSSEARGYSFVARIVRDIVGRDMLTAGQRRRIQEAASAG